MHIGRIIALLIINIFLLLKEISLTLRNNLKLLTCVFGVIYIVSLALSLANPTFGFLIFNTICCLMYLDLERKESNDSNDTNDTCTEGDEIETISNNIITKSIPQKFFFIENTTSTLISFSKKFNLVISIILRSILALIICHNTVPQYDTFYSIIVSFGMIYYLKCKNTEGDLLNILIPYLFSHIVLVPSIIALFEIDVPFLLKLKNTLKISRITGYIYFIFGLLNHFNRNIPTYVVEYLKKHVDNAILSSYIKTKVLVYVYIVYKIIKIISNNQDVSSTFIIGNTV